MIWFVLCSLLSGDGPPHVDATALARQIDGRIVATLDAERVTPGDLADDAEFLRRVSLDLIGRIPTADEVLAFLRDTKTDRRALAIDRMLRSPDHARHFARVWRALLMPEAETEPQVAYLVPGFEAWLEQRRIERVGFDSIVRELLSVPIARPDGAPQFVLRDMRKPNPLAFMAAKNAEPAKIASTSVRMFFGLRLECAQCHDHPFDHWTREQFWNQAAFFAGIERRGRGTFAPLVENAGKSSIETMESRGEVAARFLDKSPPQTGDGRPARPQFAEWMTSPDNPYFARAVTNRIWSQLMGRGLIDPVDDIREDNLPSHPELLNDLSAAFARSGFDVEFLHRAICLSETYQRTSRQSDDRQARPELFARRQVKPLSADQFFDSLAQAIAYEAPDRRGENDEEADMIRRRLLRAFESGEASGDPETSIAQALALMNGGLVAGAVSPKSSKRLQQVLADHSDSRDRQVEALYLHTLGRLPSDSERETVGEFFKQSSETDPGKQLGSVFWMLLNSAEFRWNH